MVDRADGEIGKSADTEHSRRRVEGTIVQERRWVHRIQGEKLQKLG